MKNKELYVFILLIISVCISCKQNSRNIDKTVQKTQEELCSDSAKIYELINILLNTEQLKEYLGHQKLYNQEFIAIDQTSLPYSFRNFTNDTIIFPVKFFTQQELFQNNITAYVSFDNIAIRDDTIKSLLLYDIEGVRIDVQCSIDSCTLKLNRYRLWER